MPVIDQHIDDYLHIKQQTNPNFQFNTDQLSSIKNLIQNKLSVLVVNQEQVKLK